MPSLPEGAAAADRGDRLMSALLVWNRRAHYYVGLYLLFFTWLFAFTGLLLNHPRWQFAQFWPDRVQSASEHQLQIPTGTSDAERVRAVMKQLGIAGEVQLPPAQQAGGPFSFQVSRPGLVIDVKADSGSDRVTVQRNELNAWGVMHLLHTFTGVRPGDTRNARDWPLTSVWALSMDAVAAGLIVMVVSSYVMWYGLKAKRRGGIIALAAGLVSCLAFVSSCAG